jgi:hypothetical protein
MLGSGYPPKLLAGMIPFAIDPPFMPYAICC